MYSGFWRRVWASLIDSVFLGIVAVLLAWVIPFAGGLLVWFFYAPILESSAVRATLGKKVMGIQVADMNGGRITFAASIIRNLMKFVSGAIAGIGYLVMLFTDRKQCLHDLVAETTVVMGENTAVTSWDAWVAQVKDVFRIANQPTGVVASVEPVVRAPRAGADDVAEQLSRVQAMRDRGELTAEEFEAAKRKILS